MKYGAADARLEAIHARLASAGFLTVADLAATIGVSEMTVRRDLARLAAADRVRLVHGGAQATEAVPREGSFLHRQLQNETAKDAIASAAAALIGPQDSIAIDAGSTALRVLERLDPGFAGSIVTHSVPAIVTAMERGRYRVIALGGDLFRDSAALVGPLATDAAARLRVRTLFLGAAAIDSRGVYVAADIERPAKRALMTVADRVILLADHTKFSRSAPVLLCGLDALDVLVTEQPVAEPIRAALISAGVAIVVTSLIRSEDTSA
ncbi:DeoR/GlpR family DNA-binding transcription regulator [Acidiphilium sp. AL]|uniref:DeoR/GlpR family DNA-binding transcription regulator n=1 Tax=Acidiphilium iwatense TaxID=768198 RepID=A0ABS9E000_9PROT|nr:MULTISPECIES: DeoR/GlpR family DNA-binding transcription regulator [Acidiphilium]MCF3948316.1 DeoR/GlpR family DNA-binding transcription regulator [Acidiphilium iwatense]MCU4161227.1 DeoR/GlpR family DNA-binding transcription regulator [Acidiphilium sp. AL]